MFSRRRNLTRSQLNEIKWDVETDPWGIWGHLGNDRIVVATYNSVIKRADRIRIGNFLKARLENREPEQESLGIWTAIPRCGLALNGERTIVVSTLLSNDTQQLIREIFLLALSNTKEITRGDAELLRRVAAAAGLEVELCRMELGGCLIRENGSTRWWNPLVDDGDAFRLAVQMQISTSYGQFPNGRCYVNASSKGGTQGDALETKDYRLLDDPRAATRRAIVEGVDQFYCDEGV